MLCLTRKCGERINVGPDITITVVEIRGDRVRVGIKAPDNVQIVREELAEGWTSRPVVPHEK